MRPIWLVWLVLAAALAWSAYWGWNVWQAKADIVAWLEDRRTAGWQAEWSDISVAGYPNRVDVTISDLVLANTDAGWVWSAPFLQILRLSYDRDKVILVWPDTMTVGTVDEQVEITSDNLQASIAFLPGQAREVEEAVLVGNGLTLRSDADWRSAIGQVRLAMRPDPQDPARREIGVEITELTPSAAWVVRMAEAGLVPPTVDRLAADLAVRFDRPWDRTALEEARPQPREVEIDDLSARWGRLQLRVAGELTVGRDRRPEGEVVVKATNWEEILEAARQGDALPEAVAGTLDRTFRLLSRLAGSPKTLDIPLSFDDGRMRAGPVPLGPAPKIRIP
ncbi:DUF2125 domain-containing protein [Tropicimonas isoalkanivorans]|uniref:DUF2125 domain-containing protein n=1 Tax=Tropicimonas isoalkanivorans TaxID=441112 RepID=A0A1I1PTU5_9RHOB|nr:DUF2125 domain-containing protein [Tropicimonas isoalkanivorans]SFD13087.1 hypothetical protein SAMN04488094_11644 [Tropicimonas isoalkanivorans]